jgi:hypothetical protein
MLQLEASKTERKFNILVAEFKVSYGWVQWFLNCQQLLIHRTTTFSQKVPEEYK